MRQSLLRFAHPLVVLVFASLLAVTPALAQDAEEVGGPYEVDDNTVLLLHFDGETLDEALVNASDSTDDPIAYGNVSIVQSDAASQFFPEGLGDALRLDNDSPLDSTYLAVPDTTGLDLTGNWTMEAWVYLLTYGDNSDDHRWRPKLLVKPGDNSTSQSNYYNVMRGDLEAFNTGFYSDAGGAWHDIRSPNGSFRAQEAYHVTFIRDTTQHHIVQMVHNRDRELVHFAAAPYNPLTNHPPVTSDKPAYIGINLGQGGGWLDGMIDEIRISDVVRNFPAPPVLGGVTALGNQYSTDPYEINATITTLGDSDIGTAELHYDVGDGFTSVDLEAAGEEGNYSATIPGQEFGSVVRYYVSAENEQGRVTVPQGAEPEDPEADPVYNSFAVVDSMSTVLHLTFENGEGTPVSTGDYPGLEFAEYGSPQYVQDGAPEGDYAYMLDGEGSYLELDGPQASFLNSEEFVVDFWFSAVDSLQPNAELLIKEGGAAWNNFNYRIWTTGGGSLVTPASYVPGNETGVRTGGVVGLDTTITPDTWYRLVYVLKGDTTYSQLYNADDELIDENGGRLTEPVNQGTGPFRLGTRTPLIASDTYFRGMYDDIKIYNYVPEEYDVITSADEPTELPGQVELHANYPNPFNPSTTISYDLPRAQRVSLAVYDVLGRKVATLVDDELEAAGRHQVRFEAESLASGVYFYQLDTGERRHVRKMMLVK